MLVALGCIDAHAAPLTERDVLSTGVSRELARRRAARYSDVHYDLSLQLAPGAPLLHGTERIRVTLDNAAGPLVLDWRVAANTALAPARVWDIKANGQPVNDARPANDHLVVPARFLVRGENVLEMAFESPIATSGSAVTRYLDREDGSEYIYSLFVPADASTVFPCFDQPDLKARFTLQVTAPGEWTIITNTGADALATATAGPGDKTLQLTKFRETQPISTYLFAFAAGPFAAIRDANATIPTCLYVRRSKLERARQESAEVFRLHRDGLQFLASYFDTPFPFPKYDVVLVPEFAYGGMEHAGATFLNEEVVLFPSDPTANDFIRRAETILHEASHQWFGDLVTMRWFDDLWLKEGFATFMAYTAMEAVPPQPGVQHKVWKVFYSRTKPGAYATDVTRGTTPIFQEIANLAAAKSAYGSIVYLKAPAMLRQAEFFLGQRQFRDAVRVFLKEHAYGNAEWTDLVQAFERTSGRRLDHWAQSWVQQRGMPVVRVEWKAGRHARIQRFVLHETGVLHEGGSWPLRIKVLLAYDDAPAETLTVDLPGTGATPVPEAVGRRAPTYVYANYEDYGYGRFLLDPRSKAAVMARLGAVRDDFLRALLWGSLWDSVREAETAPLDYMALGVSLVPREQDDVTARSILMHLAVAFNYYLSEAQQQAVAPRLESMLAERMMHAETVGLRITYFRAFQLIANSPTARATLKQLLSGQVTVPGMTLRSRDRFDIITALLTRGDSDAPGLLEAQSAADTTDNGRRYAYGAGAARGDAVTKQRYFQAYLHDKQLAESWLEASVGPFNAVQQADMALPYLNAALRELPTLKRTRKIFFVNDWLAAFIGGQCQAPALAIVQNFLRRETTLDPDLRRKVLEVSDGLERCVRIRRKYAR